ncbi:MAG: ParB/RepB/Spo0J family partition protein [Chloroflexi bacterium]|nr:ParB/RepB/Spo0J family partition protein [Chloroflexota bacterium]
MSAPLDGTVTERMTVKEIPLDLVQPDPDQPRKVFEPVALEALAKSLDSDGLLQPITVRPIEGPVPYMIVAGERRYTAAQLNGWKTIPAIVRSDITPGEARRLQLLENIVRENLNPIEEARALKAMLDEGFSLKDLEEATGIVPAQVGWRVQLLECRQDIIELIARGIVKPGVGHELSRLTPDGQGRALRAMNETDLTFNEVIGMVKGIGAQEAQIDMFPELQPDPVRDQAVASFTTAFDQVLRALARIENMDDLGQALYARGGTIEAQLDEAVRGLQRVKRLLEKHRMDQFSQTI